ncbi:MAG: hypothetical protein AUH96_02845 [Nitrospirae bacterium 13_2_20CM_2_61_4]|nr:MAG: hypothetical protein AUH96_02845 [Nitrospirae bacterium 13_2_20CM_2_61_4]
MPIYAGIDIGTLTLRLLIARIGDEGRLHELASERRIVRLGEGLQPSRCLQPAPMARVLETIAEWMPVIERVGAREVVAVATSAVRDAVNRDEFLREVKRRSGLGVEVVSGEEEARLSLLGIQAGLPAGVDRFVALDIGGGSTEFMTVAPGQAPAMVSVDEGVVRLTEECLRSDPVRAAELAAARARIARHLDVVEAKLGSLAGYRLVGTALAELISRTVAQRRELVGLEPGREDLILAGTLILAEAMERFGFADCLVSDYGLREGVLIDRWQQSKG